MNKEKIMRFLDAAEKTTEELEREAERLTSLIYQRGQKEGIIFGLLAALALNTTTAIIIYIILQIRG